MQAIKETHFQFPEQTDFYRGKVRDVYFFGDKMIMVATDRISAFDVILPRAIPGKGMVLNLIASRNLKATSDIVPNWMESSPDPNVTIGKRCDAYPIEMVIRGYLAGHSWREYRSGKRTLCGVPLPEGLKENDKLPSPIITPATKATEGHDLDISREEIIEQGLVPESEYVQLEDYTRKLFARGTELAAKRGLILVDTKYEFGKHQDEIYLIDEVHTPDSSRYFYKDTYAEKQAKGEGQKQLSKEFVRQWLISEGFQGLEGQELPEMTDKVITSITDRYLELYKSFTGQTLDLSSEENPVNRIEENIRKSIKNLNFSLI